MTDEQHPRNGYRIIEWFRFITPVLITVAIFMISSLQSTVNKIDDKLFFHLTNDELHTPKAYIVSRNEWNLQREHLRENFKEVVILIDRLSKAIETAYERK